jgi:diguanylate cyclase (GGDEF)-like protein
MIKPLTPAGKAFFAAVNILGVGIYVWTLARLLVFPHEPLKWGYLALFVMTLAMGLVSVRIPGLGSLISLGDTFVFATVLFYGPLPATLLAGTEGYLSTRKHTGRLLSAVSSLSVMTLSVLAASTLYARLLRVFWSPASGPPPLDRILVPLAAMALAHFFLNSTLVAALTGFARRMSIYTTWRDHYLWTSMTFFSGASAAAIAYLCIQRLGPLAFLVALPILGITYYTYRTYLGRVEDKNRHIAQMNRIHLQTIESLAMAIDAKGQTTYGHLRRVQAYAVGLAELVGTDDTTLEGIKAAALLHDVGKLAVPDYILNKPGPLTLVEQNKLRTYPRIGADILGNVDFPYPLIPMVRYHQEWWDGSGYPDGVSEERIPLGARIIAIADCADAMRCSRPYRAPASREEVIESLRSQSGAHFDPRLVEIFIKNMDALEERVKGIEVPKMGGMEEIASIHREHAAILYEEGQSRSVLTDITAARDEALALYDLAQNIGASLKLEAAVPIIMSKLRRLIAFDTGAIYLLEEKTGLIVPVHAEGENVEKVRRKTFRRGEGITGWVVENMKPMVNARAELDFYGADVEVGRQYKSAAVFPLANNGRCLGTITLYARRENHFGADEERILDIVSPQVATAIQNARAFEETQDRALTDALTGLPNSRFLYMQLEQELSRARRGTRPLGIVVIDLDRFKPINDTFGHHVGDEVLKEVARGLCAHFRAGDTVCRWAGDEFVVLLPESSAEMIEATVVRAQQGLEQLKIPTSTGKTVQVGASAGWASFPKDGAGFEELMRVADKRMYRNKTERRETGWSAVS